jgi:hypothetical protein
MFLDLLETIHSPGSNQFVGRLLSFYINQAVATPKDENGNHHCRRHYLATFMAEQLMLKIDRSGNLNAVLTHMDPINLYGLTPAMLRVIYVNGGFHLVYVPPTTPLGTAVPAAHATATATYTKNHMVVPNEVLAQCVGMTSTPTVRTHGLTTPNKTSAFPSKLTFYQDMVPFPSPENNYLQWPSTFDDYNVDQQP